MTSTSKNAIIIGATSGIGKALALEMSKAGYSLGLCGRRITLLEEIQDTLPTKIYIKCLDVTLLDEAREKLNDLIAEMGTVDVIVINSGVGSITTKWPKELNIINTNVTGFTALANLSFHYFRQRGKGHLVGVSSIAAERGGGQIPSYHASKAFISSYMEGLHFKAAKKFPKIYITDIRPGFVDTPMTEENDFMIWVAPVEKAAKQIYTAIQRKKRVAYITKRWALIAFLYRNLPDFIVKRIA